MSTFVLIYYFISIVIVIFNLIFICIFDFHLHV